MSTPPNQPVITNSAQIGNPLVIPPATVEEAVDKLRSQGLYGWIARDAMIDLFTRATESLREENKRLLALLKDASDKSLPRLEEVQLIYQNTDLTAQLQAERERVKATRNALRYLFYTRLPLGNKVEEFLAEDQPDKWREIFAILDDRTPPDGKGDR